MGDAQLGNLIAIDLFCGCGGLTQGLKQAGFRVVAAIDNDAKAVDAYRANHPEVYVVTADVREVSPESLVAATELTKGPIDLLAGCPPCQGFSSIRTLNGSRRIDDPRNELLHEFERFVTILRPRAVMMENVPALAEDRQFTLFRQSMDSLGYASRYAVLDAAEFGVPQRRRRLLFIGVRGKSVAFADPCPRVSVREAIGALPRAGTSGDPLHDHGERRRPETIRRIAQIPRDGGSRTDLPVNQQLDCHRRCNGFKDVYGRMAWNTVAPTITSGCFNPSKGRFLHPEEDRAITLREAAILQGFPSSYVFPARSKTDVARMVGNALPPPFVAAHASSLASVLTEGES